MPGQWDIPDLLRYLCFMIINIFFLFLLCITAINCPRHRSTISTTKRPGGGMCFILLVIIRTATGDKAVDGGWTVE